MLKEDRSKKDESELKYTDGKYSKRPGKTGPQAPDSINAMYFGTAGEYAVMSELLFHGYNVNRMIIDDGIDIIATKNNKYYYIQVKSTTVEKDRNLNWKIGIDRFLHYDLAEVRYIFVARHKGRDGADANMYFVLTHKDLEKSIFNGSVKRTEGNISVKIKFNPKTGDPIFHNEAKEESAKYHLNNFKL